MIQKSGFIIAGTVALLLGLLGIVLPVLPTTPWLLLALFCFTKGSARLSRWFRRSALYERYVADYAATKSLPLKRKLSVQIVASCMMLISFIVVKHWLVRLALVACFVFHNWFFIFKIKTRRPDAALDHPESEEAREI